MSTGTSTPPTIAPGTTSITTEVGVADLAPVVALVTLFVVVAGALLVNRLVMFTTLVRSDSMRPTLESGDLLLTARVHRPERLRRGDIVVFRSRERAARLVKRLIGLPGERIEFGPGGVVRVNGEPLSEPYAPPSGTYRGAFEVPPGRFLVLGDHREASDDARSWTDPYLDGRDILGVARLRVLRRGARLSRRPTVDV